MSVKGFFKVQKKGKDNKEPEWFIDRKSQVETNSHYIRIFGLKHFGEGIQVFPYSIIELLEYTSEKKKETSQPMADAEVKSVEVIENKLVIAASIIPFSIAGTLIRIALTRLQDYSGAPVFGLVYAQWVGCLIMGIAVKNKNDLFLR